MGQSLEELIDFGDCLYESLGEGKMRIEEEPMSYTLRTRKSPGHMTAIGRWQIPFST